MAVFSTKYSGHVQSFDPPAMAIFANFLPNFEEFSLDRLDCGQIIKEDGVFKLHKIDAYERVRSSLSNQ